MKSSFQPRSRSQIKRFSELGTYDRSAIYDVLDSAMIAIIGYVIDNQPFATPTIFWREGNSLYWHGSSASRMIRTHSSGTDVCVTVMLMDGLVLARSPFNHSMNYRSVMAFGKTRPIVQTDAKSQHLDRFMRRYFPERLETLRQTTAKELKATGLIEMEIEEASAKIANSGPTDEPGDSDYDCWAGTIPVAQVLGRPEDASDLRTGIAFPNSLDIFSTGERLDLVVGKLASTWAPRR